MMYKCLDCEHVFETPKGAQEDYEAYGSVFFETNECCPECFGWAFEEYDPFDDEEEDE